MMSQSVPLHPFARILWIAAIVCLGSVFISAQTKTSSPSRMKRHSASTVLSLADFGAVGDGITDDSEALQEALEALSNAGGGILQVPSGHYLLGAPVAKQFAAGISITIAGEPSGTPIDVAGNGTGLDLTSEFIVAAGPDNDAVALSGLDSFLITDVTFLGVLEVATDARVVLRLTDIGQATVRHCEFYGWRVS